MFITLLLSIYCFSLTLTATIDQQSKENFQQEGKLLTIKPSGLTYRQYLTNYGQCTVELNDDKGIFHRLTEGEIIAIERKWYKVEDCRLNRAYVTTCGSAIFYHMLDIICPYVTDHPYGKNILKRRQVNNDLISVLDKSYFSMCCQSACTITELVQYCI